jgi:hypothetical protein
MKHLKLLLGLMSVLAFTDVCTGQTVLGKHPKDTLLPGFLGQNSPMERTSEMVKAAVALLTGPGSVALSFEERIALALRMLGMLLGCTVSAVMVWSIISGRMDKRREAKIRMEREREELRVQHLAISARRPSSAIGASRGNARRNAGCRQSNAR